MTYMRAGFTTESIKKMEMMEFPVSRPYGQLYLATTCTWRVSTLHMLVARCYMNDTTVR
jgi:hypothetical protein